MGSYFKKCRNCGALLDPGEVCHCDMEPGARLAAVPAPVVVRIEERPTLTEQAREVDRALWLAWQAHRAEKATRGRKRRKKRP